MGTTSKPLRIAVTDPELFDAPELVMLDRQGHTIELLDKYDLVLGRKAWFMDQKHRQYIAEAVAAARKRTYPPKPPKEAAP